MTKTPRVLHVVPALFGGDDGVFGGAERYAFELARHMARVVPTRLVTFAAMARRFQCGELDIDVLGPAWQVRGQQTNPVAWGLFGAVARHDVIHLHQQHVLASSLSALTGRLLGRRVFVTDLGGGGWDLSAYVGTDRWYHGHLHISAYSRRVFGHEGKPWAHVIGGGVDVERFVPATRNGKDRPVLFVGRIMSHKGIDNLILGLPANQRLEIVGRPYQPDYLAHLHRLAAGKSVSFRLDSADDELVRCYQKALCIVLPSVYRDCYGSESRVPELLGQTLLEGMACGLPAVCTRVGGMPEVVRDGETGFVVPPNDPAAIAERLRWLADHPEDADRMGQRARQHVVDNFSWPIVVQRCLRIYQQRAGAAT